MNISKPTTIPNSITILHISDMQFGKFHRFAEKNGSPTNPHNTLTARLIDDLELLAKDNQLTPDLIICTGDLAEWGMGKEFDDAFDFLAKLCEHYELSRNRCVVIPGNHDINRAACSAYFEGCKADDVAPVYPWFQKWKHYKAAFDKFYKGSSGVTFTKDEPWSLFIDEELQVVVAGLNSTMDEGHDDAVNADTRRDKGHHGLCEERQYQWFRQHLSEQRFNGWLRIGAVHHNTIRGCRQDDENLRDADLLGGILSDHLHLVLHGHTHEAKADVLARKVPVYSTGSASLRTSGDTSPVPTDIPNQYQFLRIKSGSISRYCRQYAPRNSPPVFIADVRQSKSRSDWIITDDADFSGVSAFGTQTEVGAKQETTDCVEPVGSKINEAKIPSPPTFYAEPDYIGSHRFVGRARELEDLSDWAKPADPTNLLLFEAIGGNGKSMLTWEWTTKHATQVRADWAGRFWYSFYERGAIMADFCQRALAYMTGQPLRELRKKKTAELREPLLAQLHAKPWLLILDGLERVLVAYHRIDAAEMPDEDANSPTDKIVNRNPCDAIRDEDNDLLRALAAATPSKILVSSRLTPRVLLNPSGQPISGAKRITLPGLRPSDAERLLRSCGIEGDSAAIQSYLTTNCDNHPLVIGILGGLITNYLPARGSFDAWAADGEGGAKLDLASLDLIQRRNHILRAALDALPPASRQLLSTLALLSESVDYETLKAFNPHLPPEPDKVEEPEIPENDWDWDELSEVEKAVRRDGYVNKFACWNEEKDEYEEAVKEWRESSEYRDALTKLPEIVTDLEQRGLLQYDVRTRCHDLHPVVRGVAAGGMKAADKELYGQRVVDHFSSIPHNPYEQAETLQDLRPGLNVVRTLLKLGHFQQAVYAYRGDFGTSLLFNVEANAETLSLVRPFFPHGWGELPQGVDGSDASYLANDAAMALAACGELDAALAASGADIQSELGRENWIGAHATLYNIRANLSTQNRPADALRVSVLALDLAAMCDSPSAPFMSRLQLFSIQSLLGRWAEVEATWQQLESMGFEWPRVVYRAGRAEGLYAQYQYWRGTLQESQLANTERLAADGKNRIVLRYLHGLRGAWRLEQGEWPLAATSFAEAVRMARESSIQDAESETGLALAKHYLGQLAEPQREAERLAQLRQPAHRLLAHLWLALGNPAQAKHHALAAYKWAWADGEPYVNRYELTKTTELLQQMNVPLPNLPPYDPAKDEPFPWEADVRAAIDKLRAEKEK